MLVSSLFSGLVAALGITAPVLALAQSDYFNYDDSNYDYNSDSYDYNYDNYDYNYDNYDYDYNGSSAGAVGLAAFGVGMMIFIGIMGLIGLALTIFTIWMIIDAAKRDFDQKALWIILMVFFNWIPAVIYFFMVKKKNVTRAHPHGNTAPPAAK